MIWRDSAGGGASLSFPVKLIPAKDPARAASDAVAAVATSVASLALSLARHSEIRDGLCAETALLGAELGKGAADEAIERAAMLDEMRRRLNAEKAKIRTEMVRLGEGEPEWDETYDVKTDDSDDASGDDGKRAAGLSIDSPAAEPAFRAVGKRRAESPPPRDASGAKSAQGGNPPKKTRSKGAAPSQDITAPAPPVAAAAAASAAAADDSDDEWL